MARPNNRELARIIADEIKKDRSQGSTRPVLSREDFCYDIPTKDFYRRTPSGVWIPLTRTDMRKHLIRLGWDGTKIEGEPMSEVDEAIVEIQETMFVQYTGRLAGYRRGVVEFGETRILVTAEGKYINSAAGDWSTLRGVLEGLFREVQLPYFYGWVKISLQMFRDGTWLAGQVLVLCGEPGAGKNLLCSILKELFGGQMPGKPYHFMTGRTDFNSDFMGCEFLTIEDEAESTSIAARRAFGAAIKNIAVNAVQRLHAKGREALSVAVLQRLAISLNPDGDRLSTLPVIDRDVEDKMNLFLVWREDMPMPTHTPALQKEFWNKLVSELPAFVHFLEGWNIPQELVSSRFGVRHYHHPDLLKELRELSPEQRLLELIDEFIMPDHPDGWQGGSVQLDRMLKEQGSSCAREAEKLLPSLNSCGRYLARLAAQLPERFSSHTSSGLTKWKIASVPGATTGEGARRKPGLNREASARLRAKLEERCRITQASDEIMDSNTTGEVPPQVQPSPSPPQK